MGGRSIHRGDREASSASTRIEACEGEVLYDRHRREYYRVDSVGETGIALHQDGTDFYVPRSLFVNWDGRRLFSIDQTQSIEAPEWC